MLSGVRSTTDTPAVVRLGTIGYREGVGVQEEYAAARREGRIADTLLLCEHPPVYTLGTNADRADVLRADGVDVVQTDRGGEVTFHGPGQVVGYVIADLERRGRDLHRFCRDLEEIMIRALGAFGLDGARVPGLTGVWLGDEKVGALGVRVRRWISTHGFALNVNCDLSWYAGIVPCGIRDRGVTTMERALGRAVDLAEVREACARSFRDVFGDGDA
jgi:lipoate-protein ligase B